MRGLQEGWRGGRDVCGCRRLWLLAIVLSVGALLACSTKRAAVGGVLGRAGHGSSALAGSSGGAGGSGGRAARGDDAGVTVSAGDGTAGRDAGGDQGGASAGAGRGAAGSIGVADAGSRGRADGGSAGGGEVAWTVTPCGNTPPSCVGLARNCGPNGDGDCCESDLVPGGTYLRDNYPTEDATVSTFCLDKYEITVGRFRKFLAAYPGSKPSLGTGKNPNSRTDPGWEASWDWSMASVLDVNNHCSLYNTWTDDPGEHEAWPMNCLDWYYVYAFCAWDGGWMPTRLEWDYAARGGAEQRYYPWSVPPSDRTADTTYASYDCWDCGAWVDILAVGSKPKGDGRFGQSDLIGNVMEWVKDWHNPEYETPCVECADYSGGTRRDLRGGSAASNPQNIGIQADATDYPPNQIWSEIGGRCARAR